MNFIFFINLIIFSIAPIKSFSENDGPTIWPMEAFSLAEPPNVI